MSYIFDLRVTTRKYLSQLAECNQRIRELEGKRNLYSVQHFNELMEVETSRRDNIAAKGKAEVTGLTTSYKDNIKTRFAPDGAQLTDDAKLLTCGMQLTQDDLEALFDKHSGNYTMLRLLSEYADSHNIYIARTFYGEAAKLDAADTLTSYCTSALSGYEAQGAVVDSDTMWAKVIPAAVATD